jgi:hypothetical protein
MTASLREEDPRIAAMERACEWAVRLSGDVCLIPLRDGRPDWAHCTWETIVNTAGYFDEISVDDIPRLAVITDGFHRFVIAPSIGARVATWLGGDGEPEIQQIDGDADADAVATIRDAVAKRSPLIELRRDLQEVNLANEETLAGLVAANDNDWPTLRAEMRADASRIRRARLAARVAADAATAGAVQPAVTLPLVDPSEWAGKPVPERSWYLPGLIPDRTVTLLSGDGGTGKSLFALQVGVASALGVSTVGLRPAPGRVLYLAAEDEVDEFHRRIAAIVDAVGADMSDLAGQFLLVPLADRDATLMAPDVPLPWRP